MGEDIFWVVVWISHLWAAGYHLICLKRDIENGYDTWDGDGPVTVLKAWLRGILAVLPVFSQGLAVVYFLCTYSNPVVKAWWKK